MNNQPEGGCGRERLLLVFRTFNLIRSSVWSLSFGLLDMSAWMRRTKTRLGGMLIEWSSQVRAASWSSEFKEVEERLVKSWRAIGFSSSLIDWIPVRVQPFESVTREKFSIPNQTAHFWRNSITANEKETSPTLITSREESRVLSDRLFRVKSFWFHINLFGLCNN
jgi:hypothetical protein